jgi:hypothetical protein
MGVAISYTIVWMLLMVPTLLIPFRLVGITLTAFFRALWPTILPTLVMAACATIWLQGLRRLGMRNPLMDLLSTGGIGTVVYAGLDLYLHLCVVPIRHNSSIRMQEFSHNQTCRVWVECHSPNELNSLDLHEFGG